MSKGTGVTDVVRCVARIGNIVFIYRGATVMDVLLKEVR